MGCKEKNQKSIVRKTLWYPFSVFLLMVFVLVLFSFEATMISSVRGTSYIPAPPSGPNHGFINIEYQYVITTVNNNASWMFDWGDGVTTPWLRLGATNSSIIQTHIWAVEGNYTVRIKFKNTMYPSGIWSDPLLVSITTPTIVDFPSEPVLMSGTVEGMTRTLYTYAIRATDAHGYRLQYRCNFGDGTISNWTSLVFSGSYSVFSHRWAKPGNFSLKFQTLNEYGLHSSWSTPVPISMLNASQNTTSCQNLIVINGVADFMTYQADHTGSFFNTTMGRSSLVHWEGQGTYLLDDDMDGKWEYEYTPTEGSLNAIPPPVVVKNQQSSFPIPWMWIFIIIGIIVGVSATIVVLIKTGRLYIYEEAVEK